MKASMVEKLDKLLPVEKLQSLAREHQEAYQHATPYSHVVLEDVFDPEILHEIIAEFDVSAEKWKEFETKYEKKMQMNSDLEFGTLTRTFLHSLNSEPFLKFLEEITGIKGLLPDMSYNGGGLHSIPTGGKLGVHVDFNYLKDLNVYRRLNVILYLNEDWQEEYGGALEMWDKNRTECQKKVFPLFNRMVIFSTTSSSYHGHPEPLSCPKDRTRKSLALYYYTAGDRGEQSSKNHSTVWINEKGGTEELGKTSFFQRAKAKFKKIAS